MDNCETGKMAAIMSWLRLLATARYESGEWAVTASGCRIAEQRDCLCPGCRPHDRHVLTRICLGRLLGEPLLARLVLTRPRCHDGRTRGELPIAFNQAARLPIPLIVLMLADWMWMSAMAVAQRHHISPGLVNRLCRAFAHDFWRAYRPRLPAEGYIGLDVAHCGGRNHLVLAAVMPKGKAGSHVILVLPYASDADRKAAIVTLRRLPGAARLKAAACDLASDLAILIDTVWPGLPIVADLRHVVADILKALAAIRHAATAIRPRRLSAVTASGRRRDDAKYLTESRDYSLSAAERDRRDLVLAALGDRGDLLYRLKEDLLNWYKITDRTRAEAALRAILGRLDSLNPAINTLSGFLLTVGGRAHDHVLNYFDFPITTAYVENVIKLFKQRYALWSVSGDFDLHYVRTLLHDGPLSPAALDAIRWHTALTFGTPETGNDFSP
jgi:hypothetical protein